MRWSLWILVWSGTLAVSRVASALCAAKLGSRSRVLLVSTGILLCVGCYTWTPTPTSPAPSRSVRVTLKDGRVIALDQPQVVGDSLIGKWHQCCDPPWGERTAIALADLSPRIEEEHFSFWRTAGLIYLGLSAVAGFVGF